MRQLLVPALVLALATPLLAEPESGPKVGEKVDKLEVFDTTGTHSGKKVDYTADRGEKPTVYVFIVKDRWSRPIARFLRELDGKAQNVNDAYVVTVFLTDDDKATRDYLPKAQQSLNLNRTALCSYADMNTGPGAWGINTNVAMTAVVAKKGKVVATFAADSVNETDLPKVAGPLAKSDE